MSTPNSKNVDEIWKKLKEEKVSISFAINKLFPFLYILRDTKIISQEEFENCKREATSDSEINKVIYNVLENLEFNELTYRKLFCKENLEAYKDLQPIYSNLNNELQHAENNSALEQRSNPVSSTRNELPQQAENRSASEQRSNLESCTGKEGKRVGKEKKYQDSNSESNKLKVCCGKAKGVLFKDILATGVSAKCIKDDQGRWFTPREFECKGGYGSWKYWKQSICIDRIPLKKFIKDGYLPNPSQIHPRRSKISRQRLRRKGTAFPRVSKDGGTLHLQCMTQRSDSTDDDDDDAVSLSTDSRQYLWKKKVTEFSQLFGQAGTVNDGGTLDLQLRTQLPSSADDDGVSLSMARTQPSQGENAPRWLSQFQSSGIPVQCGAVTGILYKYRFVAGPFKKSIRMEERWCTPEEFVGMNYEITNGSWKMDIHSKGKRLQGLIKNGSLKYHQEDCSCYICKGNKWAENDDICAVCKQDGSLICCDSCPRSFHRVCHIPDIYTTEGKKWICTYCKSKSQFSAKPSTYPEQFVLERRMAPKQQLNCEFLFLKTSEQVASVFAENPITVVKQNLQQENYQRVGCFIEDMREIFNSFQENDQDKISEMGQKLQDEFEKNFREVFAIKYSVFEAEKI